MPVGGPLIPNSTPFVSSFHLLPRLRHFTLPSQNRLAACENSSFLSLSVSLSALTLTYSRGLSGGRTDHSHCSMKNTEGGRERERDPDRERKGEERERRGEEEQRCAEAEPLYSSARRVEQTATATQTRSPLSYMHSHTHTHTYTRTHCRRRRRCRRHHHHHHHHTQTQ